MQAEISKRIGRGERQEDIALAVFLKSELDMLFIAAAACFVVSGAEARSCSSDLFCKKLQDSFLLQGLPLCIAAVGCSVLSVSLRERTTSWTGTSSKALSVLVPSMLSALVFGAYIYGVLTCVEKRQGRAAGSRQEHVRLLGGDGSSSGAYGAAAPFHGAPPSRRGDPDSSSYSTAVTVGVTSKDEPVDPTLTDASSGASRSNSDHTAGPRQTFFDA